MKFNDTTKIIAQALLGIWAVYIFFRKGLIGVLLSGGIALISAAFVDKIELVTGITIVGGYFLLYLMSYFRIWEPFTDTPKEITERLAKASRGDKFIIQGPSGLAAREAVRMELGEGRAPVTGVYEDGAIEGFTVSMDAGAQASPANSTPAVAKKDEISEKFTNDIGNTVGNLVNEAMKKAKEEGTTAANSSQAAPSAAPGPDQPEVSPFRSDPSGLFKLGEIPTESRDGPVIDAGATFMKALQALDPRQIKSMTEDTAKMVDAQKNLIGLLNTMKPILQDGQKLMSTFTSVLGQPGGLTGAALGN
jgi:hypothetical protein